MKFGVVKMSFIFSVLSSLYGPASIDVHFTTAHLLSEPLRIVRETFGIYQRQCRNVAFFRKGIFYLFDCKYLAPRRNTLNF